MGIPARGWSFCNLNEGNIIPGMRHKAKVLQTLRALDFPHPPQRNKRGKCGVAPGASIVQMSFVRAHNLQARTLNNNWRNEGRFVGFTLRITRSVMHWDCQRYHRVADKRDEHEYVSPQSKSRDIPRTQSARKLPAYLGIISAPRAPREPSSRC